MNVKEIRQKLFMTQQELADYLGILVISVSKWERGINQPSLKHQKMILELCEKEKLNIINIG